MNTNLGLYAKAVFALLMAVLTTLYMALDGPNDWDITDKEWVNIAIAGLTALGVYLFPNAKFSDKQTGQANIG